MWEENLLSIILWHTEMTTGPLQYGKKDVTEKDVKERSMEVWKFVCNSSR